MAARKLTEREQAFVMGARTEASQEARRQAILRGIYTNEGGERLVYHGRNAANRSFLQGVGEIAKYGELLTEVDPETKKAIEDAVAEALGEEPMCELPSAEDLMAALQAIQIAEEEEAVDAGGEAIKASLEAGGAGNGEESRRQEGGRLSSRREGSRKARKVRGRRIQRGGAIGDFLRAFFRLTCGRAGAVAQQELAQRGRQAAVQAAIAQVENENPEYMERVREQWKDKLATYAQRALMGAAAIDLAGPQYTIWAVTSLLTLLSSFIPNLTLYGAAAGVLSGAGALAAGATPIALTALNAYLGVSLTRAALSRAMGGAQAVRAATLQGVVIAARDRIAAFGALNSPGKRAAIEDGIARVNNAWLTFLSDVLFFGNPDMIFRIIGVPTPAEQERDAQILAQIRAEEGAAARNRAAAEVAWREALARLVHPSRAAKIASAVAGDRMDRELRERFARADAAVQAGEAAVVAGGDAAAAQAALVAAAARVNAGVGPNANNGNGASAGARAGGLAGLARSMNRGPAAAYAGNLNLAAVAGGEAPVGERRAKRGATTNAAEVLAESGSSVYEEEGAGGGLGLSGLAAGRGRTGSVKPGKKKKSAGGGEGMEERRNSTMMGGRRRKAPESCNTRKARKGYRKH